MSTHKLFGTDGIRGTAGVHPLTEEMLARIARAAAKAIIPKRGKNMVIIGRDTRLSGSHIEGIMAREFASYGANVYLSGIITTPGLSYLVTREKAALGIMISASHNKATDNGLKFFSKGGIKISFEQEEKIEKIVATDSLSPAKSTQHDSLPLVGRIHQLKDASARYIDFLLSTVKGLNLKGVRVALDCASGSASCFAKEIFSRLEATTVAINAEHCGENINSTGAAGASDELKKLVLDNKADIGIALDGDGDRAIVLDENGARLDGDFILGIMANYLMNKKSLPQNTIVTTVMSNYGLKTAFEKSGGNIIQTSVGDKFVLEALIKHKLNLGGEQSGHIIFLDHLPTPDGLLTGLQLLQVMKDTGCKLSKLAQFMSKFPQILINIKVKEKKPFEEFSALNKSMTIFNRQLGASGRILLRYSGTEALARVMVEGEDQELIHDIAHTLAGHIQDEIGA